MKPLKTFDPSFAAALYTAMSPAGKTTKKVISCCSRALMHVRFCKHAQLCFHSAARRQWKAVGSDYLISGLRCWKTCDNISEVCWKQRLNSSSFCSMETIRCSSFRYELFQFELRSHMIICICWSRPCKSESKNVSIFEEEKKKHDGVKLQPLWNVAGIHADVWRVAWASDVSACLASCHTVHMWPLQAKSLWQSRSYSTAANLRTVRLHFSASLATWFLQRGQQQQMWWLLILSAFCGHGSAVFKGEQHVRLTDWLQSDHKHGLLLTYNQAVTLAVWKT